MSSKEFELTDKMVDFFMDVSDEYVKSTDFEKLSPEEHFKIMCDKMFASDDKEIKIDFSRVLMYEGFQQMAGTVAMKAMVEEVGKRFGV